MAASTTAPPTQEPSAFFEYHHYDGGLRIDALGLSGNRPGWAPPPEWTGFRHEFELVPGAIAVDVARFSRAGRPVNWLALYAPAVDKVFGNRANYTGLGLWIVDSELARPELVLAELRLAFGMLESHGPNAVARHLREYVDSPQLLAMRVILRDRIPPRLSGWDRAAIPNSQPGRYIARESTRDECWDSVAEQVLRMSFLGGGAAGESRALILVPGEVQDGAEGFIALPTGGFASELLQAIPIAFADAVDAQKVQIDQLHALTRQAREDAAAIAAMSRDIEAAKDHVANLEALNRQYEAQATSDPMRIVERRLDRLDAAFGQSSARLEAALRSVEHRMEESVRQLRQARQQRGLARGQDDQVTLTPAAPNSTSLRDIAVWFVVAAAVVVAVIGLAGLIYGLARTS